MTGGDIGEVGIRRGVKGSGLARGGEPQPRSNNKDGHLPPGDRRVGTELRGSATLCYPELTHLLHVAEVGVGRGHITEVRGRREGELVRLEQGTNNEDGHLAASGAGVGAVSGAPHPLVTSASEVRNRYRPGSPPPSPGPI